MRTMGFGDEMLIWSMKTPPLRIASVVVELAMFAEVTGPYAGAA
jgi:hypothetical protein